MSGSWEAPTWSCGHVREQLGAYVLDGLERDERALVADHLARCADCAAEYESLAGLPALLDHAAGLELEQPRPALEERVLDAVARERGRRRPRQRRRLPARARVAALATLAGAAPGAAATAIALGVGDEGAPAPAPRAAAPVRFAVDLHGRWGAAGRAAVVPGSSGTRVHLTVWGLPDDKNAVYEVRCEGGSWSAKAGTFRADNRGKAYGVFTIAARKGEYERIRVVRRLHGRMTEVMLGRID